MSTTVGLFLSSPTCGLGPVGRTSGRALLRYREMAAQEAPMELSPNMFSPQVA